MGLWFSKKYDPLKYLNEVEIENIFYYLSSEDIQSCSLVSRNWSSFIGNSPLCMEKLELKFHDRLGLSQKDAMLLIYSERKYNAISINNTHLGPKIKLVLANFKWTSVKFCNLQFDNEMSFLNFLGFFEPSVRKMCLKNIKVFSFLPHIEHFYIFPKLHHLEIILSSQFIVKKIFKPCREITQFTIDIPFVNFDERALKEISDFVQYFLINNENLKVLNLGISTPIFNGVFTENFVKSVKFQLNSLKLHRFEKTHNFCNSLAMENLEIFLLMNENTLENIHFENWLGFNALIIAFNEFKNLTAVKIEKLYEYGVYEDCNFISLNENPSIVHLDIHTFVNYHQAFEVILKASPNIKTLKMFTLHQNILNLMSSKHQGLEHLHLDCITATVPLKDNAFPNLKFVCAPLYISKAFLDTIHSTPPWRRTNFDNKLINLINEFKMFWSG